MAPSLSFTQQAQPHMFYVPYSIRYIVTLYTSEDLFGIEMKTDGSKTHTHTHKPQLLKQPWLGTEYSAV